MQKKEEEKREGVRPFPTLPLLLGVGLAFGLCLTLPLAVAAGIWTGVFPTGSAEPCMLACVGICTLAGGRFAVRKGRQQKTMLMGGLSGILVCVVLLMIGWMVTGTIKFSGSLLVLLLTALAGGTLAGLFGTGKGRKKKKKK